MTHTKAPWHICEVTGRGLQLIRDANGYCVAEAVKPANSGAAYIDHIANAHLIVAAPDLLAALCDAYQYMLDYNKCQNQGLLDDMQTAIAKARGEVA